MAMKAYSLIGRRIILIKFPLDALHDRTFKRMQIALHQKKSLFSLFLQRPTTKNFAPGENIQTPRHLETFLSRRITRGEGVGNPRNSAMPGHLE